MHPNPPNKDEDATPGPGFVKIRRKKFPVPAGYGGWLKSDQEMCDDMWTICENRTRKEIVACMSNPMKAKAETSADKTREHAVFVHVFASWL